ncbi:MAG: hypothetical protein GF350_03605 [Chitinivibrionales bacterium]|nr:hypothetical protein [Chitinivibrionales bacterium]
MAIKLWHIFAGRVRMPDLRALAAGLLLVLPAYADQVCEFRLTECPEIYDGDTIVVPEYVIALSSNIRACLSSVVLQDTSDDSQTPSIMFAIDNSGSMSGSGSGDPNDRWGSRFTVTRALLDTIYAARPDAEVGVIVFTDHLFFDQGTSEYFSRYFRRMPKTYDGEPDQAYLPLIKLNREYDGTAGISIIKDVLATDTVEITKDNQPYNYVDLEYSPDFDIERYTNINIAFEAAKDAMTRAENPPERRFVVFLSDGEPYGDNQAGFSSNHFTRGDSIPTTFTVYFTSSGSAPQSLETMTDNIRQNGYSSTNPQSTLWAMQTSYDALMELFMEQILTNILVPGSPTKIAVNQRSSTAFMDSTFLFSSGFMLSDTVSKFELNINYRYLDTTDRIVDDSVITSTFYVKQMAGAPVPSGIELYCEEIPTIDSIPVTATLLDTSGDGHLDRVDITWTDNRALRETMPDPAELISSLRIVSLDGSIVKLRVDSIVADPSQKTIHLILQENTGDILETGWQSAAVELTTLPMTSDSSYFYVTGIIDGAGPVIKTARYYRDPQTGNDSLVVEFSEPVLWRSSTATPSDAFNYYRLDTLKNEPFSETGPSDLSRLSGGAVIIMRGDFIPVGGIDSLQLKSTDSPLVDSSGVSPPENGRKAPVQYAGDKLRTGVIVNPFVPGRDEIPPAVRTFYTNVIKSQSGSSVTAGTVVGIQTRRPLDMQPDGAYGSVVVYDAVANVVRKDLRVYKEGPTDYGVFWDGLNSNNRKVGAGAYLFIIKTTDIDGTPETARVKVAVRRG